MQNFAESPLSGRDSSYSPQKGNHSHNSIVKQDANIISIGRDRVKTIEPRQLDFKSGRGQDAEKGSFPVPEPATAHAQAGRGWTVAGHGEPPVDPCAGAAPVSAPRTARGGWRPVQCYAMHGAGKGMAWHARRHAKGHLPPFSSLRPRSVCREGEEPGLPFSSTLHGSTVAYTGRDSDKECLHCH